MTPQIVKNAPAPGTPQWQKLVTASKVPTILGLNQYQTASELWMVMAGFADPDHDEADHLDWGHIAEDSLVNWWLHKHPGWQAGSGEIAYTDEPLPFPNMVTLDRRARRGRRFHIIECKTSTSARIWDSEDELPAHVWSQVNFQMGVSGIHEASVVSQLGSTVPRIYPVEWDKDVFDATVEHITAWHKTLGEEEPPQPPADLIAALQPEPQPDKRPTVEVEYEEAENLLTLLRQRNAIDTEIEVAKQKLIAAHDGAKLKLNKRILLSPRVGRFRKDRLPDEAKHLAADKRFLKETTSTRFDSKAFAEAYPDIYATAVGEPTWVIGKDYE